MDENPTVERHCEALKLILAGLVAMAAAGSESTLTRHLHRAVLRLLRPAEAAARRLVVVLAHGLVVTLKPVRVDKPTPKPAPTILRNGIGTGIILPRNALSPSAPASPRSLPFALLDPLPHPFRRRRLRQIGIPRISAPGVTEPFFVPVRKPPSAHDAISAARLALRLAALGRALDDLPAQAIRLARWRARLARAAAQGKARRISPLRMGRPPGWRPASKHEVYGVLDHAHQLAWWALEAPDTS